MIDWIRYVRDHLEMSDVHPEWESEVVEDLAHQIQDAYEEALSQGFSEHQAQECAFQHISDWQHLRMTLLASKRGRLPTLDRWYCYAEQATVAPHRRWIMLSDFWRDALFGLRMMSKKPTFAILAFLILALGIGATTAIFSIVNAVVLQPLPYHDPDRLVLVWAKLGQAGPQLVPVTPQIIDDVMRHNRVFERAAGFRSLMQFELSGIGDAAQVRAARVNADLFSTLGIQPLHGRSFSKDEDQPGKQVAILSFGLWQNRFGADPNIVGRTVILDRKSYTVIGVMPRSFVFPMNGIRYLGLPADVFIPMAATSQEIAEGGGDFNNGIVARLKPGVTISHANADLASTARRVQESYPAALRDSMKLAVVTTSMREEVVGDVRTLMTILFGAVALVLLIACANVANLVLERAGNRQKEIMIRAALGAGRWRLVRQFLSESLVLALAGGCAGLLIAKWGSSLLAKLAPGNIPRIQNVAVDLRVLGFAIGISILTGILFGTAPAFAAFRTKLIEPLKEGGRNSAGGRNNHRLQAVLVTTEVSIAMVLLIGAGLLIRSFERVLSVSPGFLPENVLTMSLNLPQISYGDYRQPEKARSFYRELLDRLRHVPGVEYVGMATHLPMTGQWGKIFTAEGYQAGAGSCMNTIVYGDYFKTMGIPLLRGRYFVDDDRLGASPSIIISKSMASRYFAGRDPIGQRIHWGPPEVASPWLTVVGVVGDVKDGSLELAIAPHTYEAYAQSADLPIGYVAIRTAGNPDTIVSSVRAQVRSLDSQLAVSDIETMTEILNGSLVGRRFNTLLLSMFAGVALLLAAVGLYGVISCTVTERVHEIGVRMALGAAQRNVVRMIVARGIVLTILGVAIGATGALGLTRFIATMLYGVPPIDAITFAGVAFILMIVAFLASYLPSRRAAKVDPMTALRCE